MNYRREASAGLVCVRVYVWDWSITDLSWLENLNKWEESFRISWIKFSLIQYDHTTLLPCNIWFHDLLYIYPLTIKQLTLKQELVCFPSLAVVIHFWRVIFSYDHHGFSHFILLSYISINMIWRTYKICIIRTVRNDTTTYTNVWNDILYIRITYQAQHFNDRHNHL